MRTDAASALVKLTLETGRYVSHLSTWMLRWRASDHWDKKTKATVGSQTPGMGAVSQARGWEANKQKKNFTDL